MRRLLLLALLVVACQAPLTRGTVVEKRDIPAHDLTTLIPIPIYCGKNCTMYTFIPVTSHIPEQWEFVLKGEDRSDTHAVSPNEFERYRVGDKYP